MRCIMYGDGTQRVLHLLHNDVQDEVGSFEEGKDFDALLIKPEVPNGPFDVFYCKCAGPSWARLRAFWCNPALDLKGLPVGCTPALDLTSLVRSKDSLYMKRSFFCIHIIIHCGVLMVAWQIGPQAPSLTHASPILMQVTRLRSGLRSSSTWATTATLLRFGWLVPKSGRATSLQVYLQSQLLCAFVRICCEQTCKDGVVGGAAKVAMIPGSMVSRFFQI